MTKQEQDALQAQINALKAENEALKTRKGHTGPSFKITEKGGVSVYLGTRFPVTLYQDQWNKLFMVIPELQKFMVDNKEKLSTKPTLKVVA